MSIDNKGGSSESNFAELEADQFEATLQILRLFTTDKWISWIENVLYQEPYEPEIPVSDEEEYHMLLRVYCSLHDKVACDRFAEAITLIYEITTPAEDKVEQFYSLIGIIAYIKPLNAKRLVRRDLFEGTLRGLHYREQNLHIELLLACGKYDVDEDMINFIYRSAGEVDDFYYLLAGLRILASINSSKAYLLLEQLLPYLNDNILSAQFSLLLESLLHITGCRYLYEWYLDVSIRGAAPVKTRLASLEKLLRENVLPPWQIETLPFQDYYMTLLSAQLQAKERLLAPQELLEVARLHRYFDNIDVVTNALENIWKRIESLNITIPWEFVSMHDYAEVYVAPSTRFIKVRDYDIEFDAKAEIKLDLIFERVRNACERRKHLVAGAY